MKGWDLSWSLVFNDSFLWAFFCNGIGSVGILGWNIMSMLYGEAEPVCRNTPYDSSLYNKPN